MKFLIYGATGYTGKLIAERSKKLKLNPILSGRNLEKLKQVAEPLGFEFEPVELTEKEKLLKLKELIHISMSLPGYRELL